MPVIHSNQLIKESSPYLLQHAHNPVHWFAWGMEALKAAKVEDKPILVSIGYAACHWCHVMERESFENVDTAAVMNEHFINIKIDREERPDLDHIYMDAVQAIAGNGGWPLNVFLTPDARPFYGGTYFPPEKAFGRNSWTDVLLSISDAWQNRREEVEAQARQLISHISQSNSFALGSIVHSAEGEKMFSEADCKIIAENLLKSADTVEGGFGAAPKFPQTFCIQYLLQHAWFFKNDRAQKQAELSLQKMINGGIYDQVGGGFSRYSTDAFWLVPHFEKMLYDNALLLNVLCDAFQITRKNLYQKAIEHTLAFLINELKDADGGFYAAIDADSEGIEGKFYVWDKTEIDNILQADSEWYCKYYNITQEGNWEGKNILNVTTLPAAFAQNIGKREDEFGEMIRTCSMKLLKVRNERICPTTDDKILLGWNGLLLTALCRSFASLQKEDYRKEAIELYEFLVGKFKRNDEGGMYHTYKNGKATQYAFLDDYAFFIQGCIHLQEITGNNDYLATARMLTQYVEKNFSSPNNAQFFFTDIEQEDTVVRKMEFYDSAIPSGNAVMATNMGYLSLVFEEKDWKARSWDMIVSLKDTILKYPSSFSVWGTALQQLAKGIHEIGVTGKDVEQLLKEVLVQFIPNKVLQSGTQPGEMPILKGKSFSDVALAYRCINYQCLEPVKTAIELLEQINY